MMLSVQRHPIILQKYVSEEIDTFERIIELDDIVWILYDGYNFSKEIYKYNVLYAPEEIDYIISHNEATLTWNDNYGENIIYLKHKTITFSKIINAIIHFYKTNKRVPKMSMLADAYYNPFTKTIQFNFVYLD